MDLVQAILFDTSEQVERLVKSGADVDATDIYGFPPIIEAAIANDIEKVKILLEAGALVDKTDVGGRTALHWAVDNHNLSLCQLLLSYGANANAYSNWQQSVLVMPVLRRQNQLKGLLYQHGANLTFAQDYINTKLLGHQFELQGQSHLVSPGGKFLLLNLEGFFLEFSVSLIHDSLIRFKHNYAAKELREHFSALEQLIQCFRNAQELIKYQQYTIDRNAHGGRIKKLLQQPLLLLPTAYQGHAISFIFCGNYMAKCDRGENSQFEAPITIYEITKPNNLTINLLYDILYSKQDDNFIHHGLNKMLGLKTLLSLPVSKQVSGNCSWANMVAAIPVLLNFYFSVIKQSSLEQEQKLALDLYNHWLRWDQDRALETCIQQFNRADEKRKATKAALLGMILLQSCRADNAEDITRAAKILNLLQKPEYNYILTSLQRVYQDKYPGIIGNNLRHLTDLV